MLSRANVIEMVHCMNVTIDPHQINTTVSATFAASSVCYFQHALSSGE
jgi:hypothetical protein